ncbi:Uncharacterized SAM-binding protein YcdF, DUF218 family [Granulicella pectinivorans]|uniref:Uncharacterized SAM-binding protein YcdF, DUF218 family n=1 Tax=Granulicella pectinivorans TaxID=474950 RepID=A0A1I6N0W9_9BACT|nr:Uncharacterized SAM-binding protein YcdF, DUF218 family [Granulicella pectinivorans]
MSPPPYQRPPAPRSPGRGLFRRVFGLALLVALGWGAWLIAEIHKTATEDQARAADAIVVFGAAEYSGRPSPVLHARLDHAVSLYNKQIAPVIITLGGGGDKDSGRSEGGVARDYLLANGVPYDKIIAETRSFDTEQQVARLAVIARANGLQRLVVVSDGTHLFRIRYLCEEQGLDVYTSPRPLYGNISDQDLSRRYFHEMVSYTSLRMHLHASWLRLWLAGKAN